VPIGGRYCICIQGVSRISISELQVQEYLYDPPCYPRGRVGVCCGVSQGLVANCGFVAICPTAG
jgi:hypothetical protein